MTPGQKTMGGSIPVVLPSDQTALVQSVPGATSGLSVLSFIAAASLNGTTVKASAGQLYFYSISNFSNTSWRFIKFWDKAAPVIGTDIPVLRIGLAPNATTQVNMSYGFTFATAISAGLTAGQLDSDTTPVGSGELVVNIGYK